jgi:hypothetical protein
MEPDLPDLTFMHAAESLHGFQRGVILMQTHGRDKCDGRACCIHDPSDHHMRTWPLNWRSDTGVMERICPHGVGHPDPDHMAYVRSLGAGLEWQGVHGCDGCCRITA